MDALTNMLDEVRLLYHRLVQVAERLHAEAEVSVPGRAVLEVLYRNGPATVPDIARARYVTRQHIQAIIDTLAAGDFVKGAPNPAHRRSPLYDLTTKGRTTITSMQRLERQLLQRRFKRITRDDIDQATAVLVAVRSALDSEGQ